MLTMPKPEQMLGEFKAVRVNTGQKCAIVWTFEDREVWIAEVPAIGRRRAMMEFEKLHLDQRTITKVWALEGDAHERIEARDECEPPDEPVGPAIATFPWG